MGEGVYLANEHATSLASLLTQQKQQQLKDLFKAQILLITGEITQWVAKDFPLRVSKHTFASPSTLWSWCEVYLRLEWTIKAIAIACVGLHDVIICYLKIKIKN